MYLGHDPFTGRDVALKVALPESLQDKRGGARYRKLFFNEAKVAGKLRHPNVVGVYDAPPDPTAHAKPRKYDPRQIRRQP